MEKKTHKYRVQLTEKENDNPSLTFDFDNHEDIFRIIDMAKNKNLFGDENQAIQFALGLKLFSGVMLKHRENPLFEEFGAEFGKFMKKLKAM